MKNELLGERVLKNRTALSYASLTRILTEEDGWRGGGGGGKGVG